ncbi:transposable element Tcb1 transposase [Trichonephila clavipes]|nr:transposable element Tcb1 transposase [Trichonephila clavipes]
MARIVRHNDENVREGYIRNGGKEVKLFTSALKAFQCNNRIVMAQRKYSGDFLRVRSIGRLECGRTQLEVSEELGIAQSVISRLWQRIQDDGYCQKKQTEHSIRPVSSATGTTVSRPTVYKRLGHIGLYARLVCSLILAGLYYGEHQVPVTTKRTPLNDTVTVVQDGSFGLGSRTDLHAQSVTMTGHIYRDVILEQHVHLFRGAMGAEFLFMDDNARPHRANIVDDIIGGYHPYGLASILTGLESNRACVGYAWPTNCCSSTPSHLSTGTSEGIA